MNKEQWKNNKLREYRLKAGLTQKQVAEQLGMQCEDRLSHWERGQAMPSVVNLFVLSQLYEVLPHTIYPQILIKASDRSNPNYLEQD